MSETASILFLKKKMQMVFFIARPSTLVVLNEVGRYGLPNSYDEGK